MTQKSSRYAPDVWAPHPISKAEELQGPSGMSELRTLSLQGAVSTESDFFLVERFGYKTNMNAQRFEGTHSALLLLGYDRLIISIISRGGFSDLLAPGKAQLTE